jgi:hypothetical protein
VYDTPPAATFGRGRLRDANVLLSSRTKRAMAGVSATRNSSKSRNHLLAAMSSTNFASLQPHLKPVPMALLKDMELPNQRIETVYFMDASVVAMQPDETRVEVGLIGSEGMSGMAVVLGNDQSPHCPNGQRAQDFLANDLGVA